jgi:ABC-2 type transport system ATP-binding protein
VVEVSGLTKYYGDFRAIHNVSFSAGRGEILGFLGQNGAGKTTTMRIITGFLPATEGTVHVEGFDIARDPYEARRRIGYLPENPPLYYDMMVASYLRFVGRIKGVSREAIGAAVDGVINRCSLADAATRPIRHLSKGYRQRLGLAQALIHQPSILILDEPTLGLDPKQIIEIRSLIKELAGDRTVILSTHNLSEVSQLCDRLVIIRDGRIARQGSLGDLTRGATLEEVFLHCTAKDPVEEIGARAEFSP